MREVVGFFDSGIGGLNVLKYVVTKLNSFDYAYVGDNENAPYGNKSVSDVINLSVDGIKKLVDFGCKIIVIGCNTVSVCATDVLKKVYPDVRFVTTVPEVKSSIGKTLVVCTKATKSVIESEFSFRGIEVSAIDSLAGYIENNIYDVNSDTVKKIIGKRPDIYQTVVLGCTHYAYVKNCFQDLFPSAYVDSGFGTVFCKLISEINAVYPTKKNVFVQIRPKNVTKQGRLTTEDEIWGRVTTNKSFKNDFGTFDTEIYKNHRFSVYFLGNSKHYNVGVFTTKLCVRRRRWALKTKKS